VNGSLVKVEQKLFANPNCSTAQLVVALKPLHELAGLKRVVVSTYQSVSGAGKEALDELWAQSLAVFQQKDMPMEVFKHQIAFNLIPQIDAFLPSGYTKEEKKVIDETRKILGLPNLRITCTAVRVPVFHSHSEAVSVDFERKVTKEEIIEALSKAPGIEVYTDEYPLPIDVTGTDPVHVGRIRVDDFGGCDFWIVADNLRKGAALNVVQILELWLQRKNVH
jgi:aspartate-semialdehyde dehydrogenase